MCTSEPYDWNVELLFYFWNLSETNLTLFGRGGEMAPLRVFAKYPKNGLPIFTKLCDL